ncbi:UDP-N-acetylmuramate dehydrogenase [Thermodesulfovibrio yellowstonii]|uniref:UDP-N-acetylenolpyruvoylglucosamine reductase n=1 Tax=Thermodesulfovibrio yellowstonii TaxID=28262 RepID=A0A9W6GG28_9BACT|nr:UDP-N-acetylmuramate dehydrogenase [Thermodesulfovibrio islandicus]GLI53279.1 UDP-N-acetylenolpyruvoylglucosamine reductase [Thermodesulfovibrio islandicus]
MKNIEIFLKENRIPYKKYESLAKYTTLRIGGYADFVVFPDEDSVLKLLEIIRHEGTAYYVIGGGSNLVVHDEGFKGVIINTKQMKRINLEGFTIRTSAGVMLPRLLAFVLKRKLSGIEGLIGIPGTVGGAIKGNAGSFGYEISDCLAEVEIITDKLETKILKKQDITFQYRSSNLVETWLIKSATFSLKEDDGEAFNRMKQFLQRKKQTQPLREYSAGCVFKNPEGQSAGYLIEKAGLKGFRVGDILISHLHANYFINVGKGKANDFLKLMDIVKEKVFKLFSIELVPEIKILEA